MPQPLIINGNITYKPAAVAQVDASAGAGRASLTGRVAVVAKLPWMEKASPVEVTSKRSLQALQPDDPHLQRIAKLLFNASNDPLIQGGPSAVILCSSVPSTQASRTFQDGSKDALTLKSALWGRAGNRVNVEIANNADDSDLRDFTLRRDGRVETFDALGSGKLGTISYTGSDLESAKSDTLTMDVDPSTTIDAETVGAITIDFLRKGATGASARNDTGSTWNPSLPFHGKVSATPLDAPAAGETHTVTITGTADDGTPTEEKLEWVEADGDATEKKTTSAVFVEVTAIQFENDGATSTAFDVEARAFELTSADFANVGLAVDRVEDAADFGGTKVSPAVSSYALDEVDALSTGDLLAGDLDIRADLQAIVDALATSELVDAERASGGDTAPAATSSKTFLLGGTAPTEQASDRQAAWDALKKHSFTLTWTDDDSTTAHTRAIDAARHGSGLGENEHSAYVGTEKDKTLSELDTITASGNSRHIRYCGQEVLVTDYDGVDRWMDPKWGALMLCGMKAAAPGVAQTEKFIRVKGVRQNGWDPVEDANSAIPKGLIVIAPDPLGHKVLRAVTGYRVDDNPFYSEVVPDESIKRFIRRLRDRVRRRSLGATSAGAGAQGGQFITDAILEGLVLDEAEDAVTDTVIKAFDEGSLDVVDLGDRFRIDLGVAPLETTNFLIFNLTVRRMPAA